MRISQRTGFAAYLVAVIFAADQLSKWWIVNIVMVPPHVEYINRLFNLVGILNKGITFGLMNNVAHQYTPWILIGAAVVILLLLSHWLARTSSTRVALSLGAVMGGAVGNIVDRIRFGGVIDFLDFHYGEMHWYAFNIADAAIVVGVSLLVVDSLVRRQ